MKKLSFLVLAFFVCGLVFGGAYHLTIVSAQNDDKTIGNSVEESRLNDKRLAEKIKQLTDRSTEGLTQEKSADGEITIDLQDRFQNVMVAKSDADGDVVTACVTSLGEANEFLGKDLETGERIDSTRYQKKDKTEKIAVRHGMSGREFEFYSNLITEAEQNRLMSPNAATINIVNNDGATEGFNDTTAVSAEGGNSGATRGAQRLNVFSEAASIWGAFLSSNVPINVRAQFNSIAGCTEDGGVLGSAGTINIHANFTNRPYTNTWYHAALANKLRGSDINSANPEITATFNSDIDTGCLGAGKRFYYGLNNSTPSNRVNLLVVALHEIGHGLGFSSFVSTLSISDATNTSPIVVTTSANHNLATGDQVTVQSAAGNTAANGTRTITKLTDTTFQLVGSTGTGVYTDSGIIRGVNNSGIPDAWSRLLYDRTANKHWIDMTTAERSASMLNDGNLLWDGESVKLASGFLTAGRESTTGRVQMFAPNPFQSGSSVSHFDTDATTNLLMEPSINTGLPLTLDLMRQQMRDIGWYRDSDSTLGADTITNVQPTAAVSPSASATVTWSNNGGFNKNVTVELSTNNGSTYTTLASNIANTGSYTFTAPNTTTTQAILRVTEYDFAAPRGTSSSFSILSPTAATVSVSGKVSNSLGRGVSNAMVTATGNDGKIYYGRTNSFGYFIISEIESGETYIFQVNHKRYTFAPQVLNVMEEVGKINFVAQP